MRTLGRAARISMLAATAALPSADAAQADWVVLIDGARVETKGAWTVKGNLVTFTLPQGTLGSLRAADVDLEASAKATADAKAAVDARAREAARPKEVQPVLVLTDKDVGHIEPAAAPAAADAEEGGGREAGTAEGPVQITGWDRSLSEADGGVMVTGTLTNRGSDVAVGIKVTVRLYDDQGKLIGTAPASLSAEALPPTQSARFTAVFPGILTFYAVKFDIDSTPILTAGEGTPN